MRTHDTGIGDPPKCVEEGCGLVAVAEVAGVVAAAAAVGLTPIELMRAGEESQTGEGEGKKEKEEEGQRETNECIAPTASNSAQQQQMQPWQQQQMQGQMQMQQQQQQLSPQLPPQHELQKEGEGEEVPERAAFFASATKNAQQQTQQQMQQQMQQQQQEQQQQRQLDTFKRRRVGLGGVDGVRQLGAVRTHGDKRKITTSSRIAIATNRRFSRRKQRSMLNISSRSSSSSSGGIGVNSSSSSSSNSSSNSVLTVALVMALVAYCPLANGFMMPAPGTVGVGDFVAGGQSNINGKVGAVTAAEARQLSQRSTAAASSSSSSPSSSSSSSSSSSAWASGGLRLARGHGGSGSGDGGGGRVIAAGSVGRMSLGSGKEKEMKDQKRNSSPMSSSSSTAFSSSSSPSSLFEGPVHGPFRGSSSHEPLNGPLRESSLGSSAGPVHGPVRGSSHGPLLGPFRESLEESCRGELHGPTRAPFGVSSFETLHGPVRELSGEVSRGSLHGPMRESSPRSFCAPPHGPIREAPEGPLNGPLRERDSFRGSLHGPMRGSCGEMFPGVLEGPLREPSKRLYEEFLNGPLRQPSDGPIEELFLGPFRESVDTSANGPVEPPPPAAATAAAGAATTSSVVAPVPYVPVAPVSAARITGGGVRGRGEGGGGGLGAARRALISGAAAAMTSSGFCPANRRERLVLAAHKPDGFPAEGSGAAGGEDDGLDLVSPEEREASGENHVGFDDLDGGVGGGAGVGAGGGEQGIVSSGGEGGGAGGGGVGATKGRGGEVVTSPGQKWPLRWMRRTLRAGWGRGRGAGGTGVSTSTGTGKWGFRTGGGGGAGVGGGGGVSGTRFPAGGVGRDGDVDGVGGGDGGGGVSMLERGEVESGGGGAQRQSDGGDGLAAGFEEPVRGWGLSGWVNNDGRKEWWRSSSSSSSTSGWGSGLRQPWLAPGNSDKQAWVSRPPWLDKSGLQELFKTKGGDLHIRTVARIQTLMVTDSSSDWGREDQAEETLLQLIRDPYNLGDASWTPESAAETAEWRRLEAHQKRMKEKHLKDVIQDTERSLALSAEYEGSILDYSRMNVSQLTMKLLFDLAKRQGLKEKILAMYAGEKINNTENRAVLHVALRSDRDHPPIMVDGVDVIQQVHESLDKVRTFSEQVRSGKLRGATGKLLTNIVAVGIGGSYLGPEFVHEAFKTQEYAGREQAELYRLRFLSNVDPVDVRRTLYDLDPEETLVVVISKTFTTAETMLNARTARQWLWDTMGKEPTVAMKHMAACASESAEERVTSFGIPKERLFPLWDWVGGRYSVCSSVGALPLSLKYGFRQFENFLAGARSMDNHFLHAPFEKNMPVLMGLLGVWNISFMGYKTRTILPYAEALLKFPAHIQQLAMESNGKRVTRTGRTVSYDIGQVDFGEPGTNGQHSFFQLLHMGQICPAEFIGFIESQHPLHVEGEPICSHDELMANFFAQPDALAVGKSSSELVREGCRPDLVPHRTFDGNRPSLSLLVPKVNAYHLGQMLALYEHRTAVEGFMWDINSFDQWGVELGKSLATNVREKMQRFRSDGQEAPSGLNPSTSRLMSRYLQQSETLVKKVGNINHRSKPKE